MRGRNVSTMYTRRAVRPDSMVYRETRKIGGGRNRVLRKSVSLVPLVATIAVLAVAFIVWRVVR